MHKKGRFTMATAPEFWRLDKTLAYMPCTPFVQFGHFHHLRLCAVFFLCLYWKQIPRVIPNTRVCHADLLPIHAKETTCAHTLNGKSVYTYHYVFLPFRSLEKPIALKHLIAAILVVIRLSQFDRKSGSKTFIYTIFILGRSYFFKWLMLLVLQNMCLTKWREITL